MSGTRAERGVSGDRWSRLGSTRARRTRRKRVKRLLGDGKACDHRSLDYPWRGLGSERRIGAFAQTCWRNLGRVNVAIYHMTNWRVGLGVVLGAAALVVVLLAQRGPAIRTQAVERRDMVRTIVANGRVMSPTEVKVGALVAGTATAVLARAGQRVKEGEVLLQLDDAAAKAEEKQALARLAEARASRRSVTTLDLTAATQQLAQARARLEFEQKNFERAASLAAKQAAPPSEAELAQTNLQLAQSQVLASESQLAAVSSGGSGALRAAAALALAEAQLELSRVTLSRTQVRAPAEGVILEQNVEPGDLVAAGTSVFVLSTTGATRVVIEPDERSLADISVGQTARVSTEAFPQQSFDATVSYIAPSVNPRRGTIEVRLDVPSPPVYLLPDMTVSVEVLLSTKSQVVVVPRYAIHERLQEPWLFVVNESRLERRTVQLGVADSEYVEVLAGIADGETIVAEAGASLKPGQRVRVQGAGAQ